MGASDRDLSENSRNAVACGTVPPATQAAWTCENHGSVLLSVPRPRAGEETCLRGQPIIASSVIGRSAPDSEVWSKMPFGPAPATRCFLSLTYSGSHCLLHRR